MATTAANPEEIVALAATHGLEIDPATVRLNEAGLDYRVAHAREVTGAHWVLRIPRRAGLATGARVEALMLDLVRSRLEVTVPDWRVHADDLIAYPLLPGEPALTIADGEPTWHVDLASQPFARAYGQLVGQLHQVPVSDVARAGLPTPTMAEIRAARADELARVAAEFRIAPDLRERWDAWLADTSCWPQQPAFTHGELYHAHILIADEGTITGVLDWTTAGLGDPVKDLVFQANFAPPEAFATFLEAYQEAGGSTWPGLERHCAHLHSFTPVNYGLYALVTGEEEHRTAAQALLDPS